MDSDARPVGRLSRSAGSGLPPLSEALLAEHVDMSMDAMRREYHGPVLRRQDIAADPVETFQAWFEAAAACDRHAANVITLATVDARGYPDARIVLLKEVRAGSEAAFGFFTGGASAKAQQLAARPQAALVSYWSALDRQVRVRGVCRPMPRSMVETYYHSRPRSSQLAAACAVQGTVIADRDALEAAFAAAVVHYGENEVPVPAEWTGYFLHAEEMEFWQGQANRLHDRILCRRAADGSWRRERLAP